MKPEDVIAHAVTCHAEWAKLTEKPQRPFKMYLAEKATTAFIQLRTHATLHDQLPKEVRRALRIPSGLRLGPEVLKRYTPELTALWLKDTRGLSLLDFMQLITRECTTEGELQEYLNL